MKNKGALAQAEIWVSTDPQFTDEQKKEMLACIRMLLDEEGRHKREKQWELEVKHGMTGWIQANWPKLCSIQCDCGDLISYDVLRESNQLLCKKCCEK